MKIAPNSKPPVSAKPAAGDVDARQKLSKLATQAVAKVMVAQSTTPNAPAGSKHPLLEGFGKALGVGLGVVVTEALRAVPSWNKPVLDAQGKPATEVPGATKTGNYDILKRHEEVVGPQVAALVAKLPQGAVHDLLDGFAKGATEAPGDSYRLDAKISDVFEGS